MMGIMESLEVYSRFLKELGVPALGLIIRAIVNRLISRLTTSPIQQVRLKLQRQIYRAVQFDGISRRMPKEARLFIDAKADPGLSV